MISEGVSTGTHKFHITVVVLSLASSRNRYVFHDSMIAKWLHNVKYFIGGEINA